MKIRIKKDASAIYINGAMPWPNWPFANQIKELEGQEFEVKTEKLKSGVFTIHGGHQISEKWIDSITDDIRHLYHRCDFCGKSCLKSHKSCPDCGEPDFTDIIKTAQVSA